ncbi:MAG: hypothetical protein LBI63_03870 [Candidatus Ancillula sp.]|nr:hypothetical protein [Candidatus Ancillula sp.]
MYRALWNLLPVPTVVKIVIFLLLFALFVVLCFTVIFPFVVNYIPYPFGNKGFE